MYQRLLSSIVAGTPVHHWGDVDEGGFRIASVLAKASTTVGHAFMP